MEHVDSPTRRNNFIKVAYFDGHEYVKSSHASNLKSTYFHDYGYLNQWDDERLYRMVSSSNASFTEHSQPAISLLDACTFWEDLQLSCTDDEADILSKIILFGNLFISTLRRICRQTPEVFIDARKPEAAENTQKGPIDPRSVTLEDAYHLVLSLLPEEGTGAQDRFSTPLTLPKSSNYCLIESAAIFIKKLAYLVPNFMECEAPGKTDEIGPLGPKDRDSNEVQVTEIHNVESTGNDRSPQLMQQMHWNKRQLLERILSRRSEYDRASFAGPCSMHSKLAACHCSRRGAMCGFQHNSSVYGKAISYLHPDEPLMNGLLGEPMDSLIHDDLSFLQGWYFFGLLTEIFSMVSMDFDVSRYCTTDSSGQKFVTTDRLKTDMDEWKKRLDACPEMKARILDDARVLITTTMVTIVDHNVHASPAVTSGLVLSIRLLGEGLEEYISCGASHDERKSDTWILRALVGLGRCPSQTWTISQRFKYSIQYYIYLLGPARRESKHDECSVNECQQNNIDESQYEQSHFIHPGASSCFCELSVLAWEFDNFYKNFQKMKQRTIEILNTGGIPVVSIRNLNNGNSQFPRLEIVKYTEEIDYTAISHVWSDGLGNPNDNVIPFCKAMFLTAYLNPISSTPRERACDRLYFWLDTICIPVPSSKLADKDSKLVEKSRKLAISRMRETYSNATRTLVLDSELMGTPFPTSASKEAVWIECVTRTLISVWNTRMWTFSEASLKTFYVLFDQTVFSPLLFLNASEIFENEVAVSKLLAERDTEYLYRNFEDKYGTDPARDGGSEASNGFAVDHFLHCWSALRFRTTSKIKDQVICMSTLLALDTKQILEAEDPSDPHRPYKTLLALQGRFASQILFYNVPKLPEPGFRWAPRSLMDRYSGAIERHFDSLSIFEPGRGLIGRYPGLLLPAVSIPAQPQGSDSSSRARTFLLDLGILDEDGTHFHVHIYNNSRQCFHGDWPHDGLANWALILQDPLSSFKERQGSRSLFAIPGALVLVQQPNLAETLDEEVDENSTITCLLIDIVAVSRIQKGSFSERSMDFSIFPTLKGNLKPTPDNQLWCIR